MAPVNSRERNLPHKSPFKNNSPSYSYMGSFGLFLKKLKVIYTKVPKKDLKPKLFCDQRSTQIKKITICDNDEISSNKKRGLKNKFPQRKISKQKYEIENKIQDEIDIPALKSSEFMRVDDIESDSETSFEELESYDERNWDDDNNITKVQKIYRKPTRKPRSTPSITITSRSSIKDKTATPKKVLTPPSRDESIQTENGLNSPTSPPGSPTESTIVTPMVETHKPPEKSPPIQDDSIRGHKGGSLIFPPTSYTDPSRSKNKSPPRGPTLPGSDWSEGNYHKPHEFGFKNHGNTCYVSATLQALLGLQGFVRNILRSELLVHDSMTCNLQAVFLAREHSPETVDQAVKNLVLNFCSNVSFKLGEQQDAQEFLIKLLQQIKTDISHIQSRTYFNYVEQYFFFQYYELYNCNRCGIQRGDLEDTCMLMTAVGSELCTVQDLLNKQSGTCPSCSNNAVSRYVLQSPVPRYLIINLLRYIVEDQQARKINTAVSLCHRLRVKVDEDPIEPSESEEIYSLTSVVTHAGDSTQRGHYTADVCHDVDGRVVWCHYDDNSNVTTSDLRKQASDCYILMYTRVVTGT